jgi:hypothetical protein
LSEILTSKIVKEEAGKIINNHGNGNEKKKKRHGQATSEIARFSKCTFYHSTFTSNYQIRIEILSKRKKAPRLYI